jgi:hypothetical protein
LSRWQRLATQAVALMAAASPVMAADRAFVLMGEGGAVARLITPGACPAARIDGRDVPMALRAGAATVPQRPTASPPALSKPSAFPVNVCEAAVPALARQISVAGQVLPAPHAKVRRIVVIGDTGCRLKAADQAYQACRDPAAFPFARIAASAAAWRPDLVIHVGDYHYRENPCPTGNAGCAESPWGYGWDAWDADFFTPSAPLLAVAPLAAARGNHESCARAGQGWWRFLDGHAVRAGQDCNDAGNDRLSDVSAPFAVNLGGGAKAIIMDLSAAAGAALADADWRVPAYRADFAAAERLAQGSSFAFMVNHYPILGFGAGLGEGAATLKPGNAAIQSVFGPLSTRFAPRGVDVLLAGHIHLWEQLSFASDHPSQFITGFSGTLEDKVPMPARLPAGASPAPGAVVNAFSSWVDGFGFMTLTRHGLRRWDAEVRDVDGRIVNRCRINGSQSRCDHPQVNTAG